MDKEDIDALLQEKANEIEISRLAVRLRTLERRIVELENGIIYFARMIGRQQSEPDKIIRRSGTAKLKWITNSKITRRWNPESGPMPEGFRKGRK